MALGTPHRSVDCPGQPTEKGKDVEHDQKPADWEDYDPEMNHMNGKVPEVISD